MGLRSRFKNRIKRALGGDAPSSPGVVQTVASPRTASPAPAPAPAAAPAPAEAPAPALSAEEQAKAEKAAAHLEKTRRAVLRFVEEAGGESNLGEMHDYSERRWFVGHRKFSDLMEGLVAEALVDYNGAEGRATLTEAGRQYLVDNPPPKRK